MSKSFDYYATLIRVIRLIRPISLMTTNLSTPKLANLPTYHSIGCAPQAASETEAAAMARKARVFLRFMQLYLSRGA